MKVLLAVLVLVAVVGGVSNVLFCDICVDIITDIDEFLVSEPSEQAVIDFVAQVTIKIKNGWEARWKQSTLSF